MEYYRLYFVQDGHFTRYAEFEADGDEAAIEEAKRRQKGEMELWCGTRRVKIFTPTEPGP